MLRLSRRSSVENTCKADYRVARHTDFVKKKMKRAASEEGNLWFSIRQRCNRDMCHGRRRRYTTVRKKFFSSTKNE